MFVYKKKEKKKTHTFTPRILLLLLLLTGCLKSRFYVLVYLRGGSAKTIVCAVTLREKLQIKLVFSPSQSMLTPGLFNPNADHPTPGAW